MKIAILGAGRAGHEVSLLARDEHLAALRGKGLEVRSAAEAFTVRVSASDVAEDLAGAELAIVSVKTYSLDDVAPAARFLAEAGASILPLLNGVEAVDRLLAHGVPTDRVLGGLTEISAARVAPGVVEKYSPFQRVALGELSGAITGRVERIAAALREAGVDVRVSKEITADLWRKLAFIASMASACGLARSPIGPLRETPLGREVLERAVNEVFAVARARGLAVGPEETAKVLRFVDGLGAELKPSLLRDLEAGAKTEIDDLSGAVSRLGRLAGVETPFHDTATVCLRG
jgi:2-dehydropantoate 2-reductase